MDELASLPTTLPSATPSSLPTTMERRTTTARNRVQCKQDLVISWLQEFYTHPGHLEILTPILKGDSPISLRLIDYFVTNYSKKNNTSYNLNSRLFLVYFHYKRELNAYSKRLFDPFCRRERILFQARGHEGFVTTVGQLNFFRWAIEKQILQYITENREAIEKDMNTTLKEHYSRSTKSKPSTRTTIASATSYGAATLPDAVVGEDGASTEGVCESDAGADAGADASEAGDGSSGDGTSEGSTTRNSRKKRSELTKSAMRRVNFHACQVTVSFA